MKNFNNPILFIIAFISLSVTAQEKFIGNKDVTTEIEIFQSLQKLK